MSNNVDVSVLMSVYNETEAEVTESIESLLKQTYQNFEIIIVNDNPKSEVNKNLLEKICLMDPRIRVINNAANMGLALSMNEAAKHARGIYFARMDADDVCYPERLQRQMDVIKTGEYDLICSGFVHIDEASNPMPEKDSKDFRYTPEMIKETLPYKSIIHHPTVVMTRDIFDKVGGYRNFPCSQDYDLWLRMLYADARFYIVPEPLIQYRIRSGSISVSKRLRQKLTIEYIRDLYVERLRKGKDSFSQENYQRYLKKYIQEEQKQTALINESDVDLSRANQMIRGGNKVGGLLLKMKVFCFNPVYRHVFSKLLVKKYEIKYLQRKLKK